MVDLRRNGGGSLEEAISLTGLFCKSGPIVRTKGSNGSFIVVSPDPDPGISFHRSDGCSDRSRQSASASLARSSRPRFKDYGRAVIVGDKNTFGKGTVSRRFSRLDDSLLC